MNWRYETFKDAYRQGFVEERLLASRQSPFQLVEVLETRLFGRMLMNDGFVMTTTLDEFVYHEMLVHVPLQALPDVRDVLIIGGGDGGTAREAARYPGVSIDMVEIDPVVIEFSRAYLPETACGLDHPAVNLFIEDGVAFVERTERKYDVVLVDSTEPFGPAEALFNEAFYRNVHRVLKDDGVVVAQADSPYYSPDVQRHLAGILRAVFGNCSPYNYSNCTYPGGLWSFFAATKGLTGLTPDHPKELEGGMRYYTPSLHTASFCLPAFQSAALERQES